MPEIKRRHFLQMASSTLASFSLSQCKNNQQNEQATPTLNVPLFRGINKNFRRLALLIGINNYAPNSQISPLQGCLTDVEIQKYLLVYHFGFNLQDILILTDSQATREGILTAFEEHLIKQAKPGDFIVFHYSGHGSQVADPDRDFPDGLNSTIVPFDSSRPAGNSGGIVQDITGRTLFLLMSALATENVTFILDCCYSGGAKRGNLKIRAIKGGKEFQASPEEISYQQQWLTRLNLASADFKKLRRRGVAKGVVIAATNRDQLAADYPFNGFSAGAFTYLMSQYLWQNTARQPLRKILPYIARSTSQVSFTMQMPEYEVKPGSNNDQKPIYFLEKLTGEAEAVITKVENKYVEIWLGGVDSASLDAFNKSTVFVIVNTDNKIIGEIQLESRSGLIGRGKLLDKTSETVQPGALCLEKVRGIPNDLSLKVGIKLSSDKEREIAFNDLATLPRIQVLSLEEREVHCIFGRVTEADYQQRQSSKGTTSLPVIGSLGLFSPGGEVIKLTFSSSTETVSDAIKRLQTKFRTLLAVRIVKMILNSNSSRLNITARIQQANGNNLLVGEVIPMRGIKNKLTATTTKSSLSNISTRNDFSSKLTKLPINTPVELQITNNENRDIYVSVLVISSIGEIAVLFPNQWTAPGDAARLTPGETLLFPNQNQDEFSLQTQEPLGITEILVIASIKPLRKALKGLQVIAESQNQRSGPIGVSTPLEVIEDLLEDLGGNEGEGFDDGQRGNNSNSTMFNRSIKVINRVDTGEIAAISIVFEVI